VSDVTPITPVHECASCKATIDTLRVYEGHAPTCMQPEIRMRRLEARVSELSRFCADLHEMLGKIVSALEEDQHGSSKDPDTQRSSVLEPGDGLSEASIRALWNGPYPDYRCEPHPDTSAAATSGEAPAGAEPAGSGPERTG
jgi:hypothetical protein